ncbi:hypothetical protein LZ32DRAFT_671666 [Colletotrichum eremochloae]|nr:hypothetical protein LZ32DRAFT_671666 [Colletotrichum eremochloae]
MAVFGPLKQAYRKEVGCLDEWVTDSTTASKRAFLECYFKARKASITIQNVKSGWKSAGLWPVTIRRPLSKSLVTKASPSQQASQPSSQQWDEAVSVIPWSTTHRPADLRHQLHQLTYPAGYTHTIRRLSRKVQKGYDEEASRKALLERQRSCKRKKVTLSPNSTFATIEHIQRAQNPGAGEIDGPDESSASKLSSEAKSCIWVGGKPKE